jgi:hypothetical protein
LEEERATVSDVPVRGLLSHRITVTQAILVLGALLFFVSLLSTGDLLAGLGVLALIVVAVSVLAFVHRRRLTARTVRLEETAMMPYSCEVVWGLIKPAEKAPLVEPELSRGYQVPGTPEGIGERQALERHDGTTVIVEVIEYEANRRAVVRQVSPRTPEEQRTLHAVEPVTGGCMYTEAIEFDLKAGQRIRAEWEGLWRSAVKARIARIRALLDSAADAVPKGEPPAAH